MIKKSINFYLLRIDDTCMFTPETFGYPDLQE